MKGGDKIPRQDNPKKVIATKIKVKSLNKKGHLSRGDLFYYDFSKQNGSLQSGRRPVVIIQNDTGNIFSPTTIVASVTSKIKCSKLTIHVAFKCLDIVGLQKQFYDSTVLFEQIFTVNKTDLRDKIGWINLNTLKMQRVLEISLGLK